eukprot:211407-Hanusia_phi.AAC.4
MAESSGAGARFTTTHLKVMQAKTLAVNLVAQSIIGASRKHFEACVGLPEGLRKPISVDGSVLRRILAVYEKDHLVLEGGCREWVERYVSRKEKLDSWNYSELMHFIGRLESHIAMHHGLVFDFEYIDDVEEDE